MTNSAVVMKTLGAWRVEHDGPFAANFEQKTETLCWSDPKCGLSVSRVDDQSSDFLRLRIGGDLVIDVKPDWTIVAHPGEGYSSASLDHVLTDLVLPRLISQSGTLVIHAGAVRSDRSAIMLMGLSGRGKSTLASSFHQAGFALLGDDAMVVSWVEAVPSVRPVYPSLRLLPDSVEAVLPGIATSGSVAQYSIKQRIDLPPDGSERDWPLSIAAVFVLAEPDDRNTIVIRRTSVADFCMALVESSFALDPSDTGQARRRLKQASAVASAVPAFEISYPRDYARLPEVRQAILEQVAALETT